MIPNRIPRTMPIYPLLVLWMCLGIAWGQPCLPQHEFQNDLGTCQPCFHKCLTCIDASPSCDSCNSQYYLDLTTLQCQQCLQGCSVCHNSSTCSTCNTNFYLNSNGTCTTCTVGASSCTISTISSCIQGYYLLNSICAKCVNDCQTCNNSVTCKVCFPSYYLNSSDSTCTKCGNNCNVCSSATGCTECATGFQPTPLSNACSQCAGAGNLVYAQATSSCILCPNYCLKCDVSICYYCQEGFILSGDQKSCQQGGSLLCYQSKGKGYTNCQVDINGCPSNTNQQYDTSSGFSVPTTVCLPKSFTPSSQYIYDTFTCGTGGNTSNSYTFVTKPKYSATIEIQLMIMMPIPTSITIQYGTIQTQVLLIPTSVSSYPVITSSCGNFILYNTKVSFPGTASFLSISSGNALISEIYLEANLCTVLRCATCTTNLDCTSCLSPYYLQLNECVQQCETGFYTYQTMMTCHITCPDTTYPISSQYSCKDCNQNNCYLCTSLQVCLSCQPGYFLYKTTCVSDCQATSVSTYYGDVDNNVCRQCPFPCKTCSVVSNITTCFSCNVGYLYNTQCVFVCPNGTHPLFTSTLLCVACNMGAPYYCSTCTINSTTCSSCVSPYYLLDSQCLVSCPSGYYSDNRICYSCQSPCQTCSSNSLNCSSCSLGSYYFNASNSAGQCLLMCPNGTYNNYTDTTNPLCSVCSPQCSTCYGALSTQCLSCTNGYYMYGSSCLSSCASDNSTYQNTIENLCSPCIPPCRTCSTTNGSQCSSCTVGFLSQLLCSLVCNQTSYPQLTSTIYTCTSCPSRCYSCNSSTICKSCVSPYLLLNNECIEAKDCLPGYYNDTMNLLCRPCSSPCVTCSNSISCITCIASHYLYNNSKCVSTCPDRTFLATDACQSCDPSCATCSVSLSNCTSCFAFNNQLTYLHLSTCVSNCPTSYYSDSSTSTCEACSPPCLECHNLYLCITCLDPTFYLFDNQCLEQCPSSTLPSSPICQLCTDNCSSCSNITGNCTSCSQLYYYHMNTSNLMGSCLETCPSQFYSDIFSGTCLSCISPCLECRSETVCTTCIPTHSLYIETCIANCPSGYYSENNICKVCVLPCSQCSSITNCTMCGSGYFMPYGGVWTENCLVDCPLGQYADVFNRKCSLCDTNCLNCSSLSVCYNCSGSSYLHLTTCLPQCLTGYYPQNNKCNPCSTGCSRCSSPTICSSCTNGYRLFNSTCFSTCPSLTYPSISVYENILICYSCSSNCLSCSDYYQCLECSPTYFLQNGQCTSSCSLYYYNSSDFTCLPCGFSCSKCLNQTYCLNCTNTYIHQNQCFSICPETTYSNYSSLTCIPCVSPCLTCINQHSCITCIDNYKFYESICVSSCPNNTWLYNNECISECLKYKDYESMICYDQCPMNKVAQNNICLSECSPGTYVSIDRICTECSQSSECKYLFKGNLQLVAVDGFKLVLYFNQRSQLLVEGDIKVTIQSMEESSRRLLLSYTPTSVFISDRAIDITYSIPSSERLKVTLEIPYIQSMDTSQSISSNRFTLQVYNYSQPSPKFNFKLIGYVVSIFILILFVLNILYGVGHYQAVLELAQIFAMLNYLQIYYPWPLYQFYQGLQLIMFAPLLNISSPYLYSFSPPKFINYNSDIEFMRSCLASILVIFLPIAIFLGVICLVVYLKREVSEEEAPRMLRFCRVIKGRVFWRYLNDFFFVGMVWIGVFAVATFRNQPLPYTIGSYVFAAIAIIVIVAVIVAIFFIVLRAVRKRKRDLGEIEGLVEDLEDDSSTLGLMYTPILYLRKLLLICLIGLYSTYPISSLFMLMVLSALLLVILFFYKPFKNPVTDYIVITLEFCLIFTIFLLVLLKMNEDILSDSARFGIGMVVLIIDVLVLLLGVGWWGYLTVANYVLKLGVSFGQIPTNENEIQKENMISDNSSIGQRENKLNISNALNDLTNKHHRKDKSQLDSIKDSNKYEHGVSDSNSSQPGSEESKDMFKHYRSEFDDDDEEKDLPVPARLKKESIRKDILHQQ